VAEYSCSRCGSLSGVGLGRVCLDTGACHERRYAKLRDRAETELAALREALRGHMHSFTDHTDTDLCGGCLRPSPCPDAALAEEP
jgi:hypothetical protein